MKREAMAVLCLLLLQGCGVPASVKVASWAIDGILFLTTEKSATDHGLSLMAQKDCALWRGLKGEDICSETVDDAVAVAATDEELADFATAAGPAESGPAGDMFFVLGSFSEPGNADELARRHGNLDAGVVSSRLEDRVVFRVVVGPFELRDQDRVMGAMRQEGIAGAWALRLDRSRHSEVSRPSRLAREVHDQELAERRLP